MKALIATVKHGLAALLVLPLALGGSAAWAAVAGVTGPTFNLTAKAGYISTSDGNSLLMWGYANSDGLMQYPGPTLIVTQGDVVTVSLKNSLPVTVSMVFPGQSAVTAAGGTPGLIAQEAAPGATVTYSFTASQPGTYIYYSGTNPGLQVEMGLVGAMVVRPAAGANQAYADASTAFDREYLFVLTEADKRIHEQVAYMTAAGTVNDASVSTIDLTSYHATLWFFNGRNGPDSMFPDGAPWLPTQPYGSMARMHPGERVLIRMVGGGRDMHPFHAHGNHMLVVAQDGRPLATVAGGAPDLAHLDYTQTVVPGETYDALFTWSGQGLGWDIYGTVDKYPHTCIPDASGFDAGDPTTSRPATREWCEDHNKPIKVSLPQQQDTMFGGFWSGSPYLGVFGALPPGEGGLNPNSGFTYMWHSHSEVELTNDDIFPGGMMTMLIVEPPGVPIQ
jgi:FtsP/CotA-like multicopper oxidase with cupredoxin domain